MDLRVALLEDEPLLKEALEIYLQDSGFVVESFERIERFYEAALQTYFNFIIADITLEDGNFLKFLQEYPFIKNYSKILIISGDTQIDNIKKSFHLGADDFIKKPFDYEEIELRIRKLLRGFEKERICENFFFDGEQGKIGGEREVLLSERELELFKILLSNNGKFVPVEHLVGWIWGEDTTANTLAALVKRLRKKLPTCMEIASHRGRGYALLGKEAS